MNLPLETLKCDAMDLCSVLALMADSAEQRDDEDMHRALRLLVGHVGQMLESIERLISEGGAHETT